MPNVTRIVNNAKPDSTVLDLSNNSLWFISSTDDEIEDAFTNTPRNLKRLDLSSNQLRLRAEALRLAFVKIKDIPITHIDLSINNFAPLPTERALELKSALEALPKTTEYLDLSTNGFDLCSGDNLKTIFSGLSALSIRELNLKGNQFGLAKGDDLKTAFSGLPKSIDTLDLSYNQLEKLAGGDDLKLAFSVLPHSIKTLKLEGNRFDRVLPERLKVAFDALPYSVTTIDLSNTYFTNVTATGLVRCYAAIPSRLRVTGLPKLGDEMLSECLEIAIKQIKKQAKENPKENLQKLENILNMVTQYSSDKFKNSKTYEQAKNMVEVLRCLTIVQTSEASFLNNLSKNFPSSQKSGQFISQLSYGQLFETYASVSQKLGSIESDEAKEALLDIAHDLYRIERKLAPKGVNVNAIPSDKERLEMCNKILDNIPDDYPNEKILNAKNDLKANINNDLEFLNNKNNNRRHI